MIVVSLPAASVTVTVAESYDPASKVSNVIVLFPTSAVTSPVNVFEAEIAPTSLLFIVSDGVTLFDGVVTATASETVGAVVSITTSSLSEIDPDQFLITMM